MKITISAMSYLIWIIQASKAQNILHEDFECPIVGMDFNGTDLKSFEMVGSWQICASFCGFEPKCKAWSWGPNAPNKTATCWLKDSLSNLTSVPSKISGKRGCTGKTDNGCPIIGVNFPNNNIKKVWNTARSWESCSHLCHEVDGCRGWVWQFGLDEYSEITLCLLKSNMGEPGNFSGIGGVSGGRDCRGNPNVRIH